MNQIESILQLEDESIAPASPPYDNSNNTRLRNYTPASDLSINVMSDARKIDSHKKSKYYELDRINSKILHKMSPTQI